MILQFNPDGSIVGYNTDETKQFLQKIGTQTFAEEATIQRVNLGAIDCYAVLDSSGHECPCCGNKKHSFIELINERVLENPKVIGFCANCLETMSQNLRQLMRE